MPIDNGDCPSCWGGPQNVHAHAESIAVGGTPWANEDSHAPGPGLERYRAACVEARTVAGRRHDGSPGLDELGEQLVLVWAQRVRVIGQDDWRAPGVGLVRQWASQFGEKPLPVVAPLPGTEADEPDLRVHHRQRPQQR
jgi:hypothetical protein